MRVIEIGSDPAEYLIQAGGVDVTLLADAVYQRALALEGAIDRGAKERYSRLLLILAAIRQPYVARRD